MANDTEYTDELQIAISLWKERDYRFIVDADGKLHEKQNEALCLLTDTETEELGYGGAAGGAKSWTGCVWLVMMALAYPDTKWFIGREELTRLLSSTYITFQKVCKKYGLRRDVDWVYRDKYHYVEFTNGSRIDFLDVKYVPRDPLYERFGSSEYTGGWLEEGGEIHFGAYDTLRTRVGRHNNEKYGILAKLLVTLNPKKNWCHQVFWKPFKANTLPKGICFLQALVTDNPYIDAGYIDKLRAIKDKVRKQRLLYGNFDYDDDDNALMDYDSIMNIFTNDFVEDGEGFITADIARFGKDKSIIMRWKGWRMVEIVVLIHKKTTEVAAAIRAMCAKHRIPISNVVVDEDGVGGGVVDELGCKGFVNNSSPLPEPETPRDRGKEIKPNYANLRSQCYFRISERVNDSGLYALVADPETRETISEELEQIKKADVDNDKKLQVVDRKTIVELLGRSPDYASSLMMRDYFELKPPLKPQRNLADRFR